MLQNSPSYFFSSKIMEVAENNFKFSVLYSAIYDVEIKTDLKSYNLWCVYLQLLAPLMLQYCHMIFNELWYKLVNIYWRKWCFVNWNIEEMFRNFWLSTFYSTRHPPCLLLQIHLVWSFHPCLCPSSQTCCSSVPTHPDQACCTHRGGR